MPSLNSVIAAAEDYFRTALSPAKADELVQAGLSLPDPIKRRDFFIAAVQDLEDARLGKPKSKLKAVKSLTTYRMPPVPVRKFVEDDYFLGMGGILFPTVLACVEEMNNGTYQEAVLTGSIGTGKTTIALVSTAYQLYILSCYTNPHELFGLDPSSEIMFIFQSINASLAKSVDFDRFRTMIMKSPYFMEHFPPNKDLLSELRFPNRIIVKPVSGAETGAIGQNVIGGIIDELNFMAVVQNSKSSMDGVTYDQAVALYNSIAKRRKSRFMSKGKLPGLLCLVSSKRYPGQFTDIKEAEARAELDRTGKTSIYVYDKRVWEIKPPGTFLGKFFPLFVGDSGRKAFILPDDAVVPPEDEHLVMQIPVEYRGDFESDMIHALRDIAGVSTLATHPFIVERSAIKRSMRTDYICVDRETVDFVTTRVLLDQGQFAHKQHLRFAHIDLAVSGDSAGLVIGCVTGFSSYVHGGVAEYLPQVWIDLVLEIKPPKNGEIIFSKIREVIYAVKKLGLNVRWVTFDQFQSVDSMQILKQNGYQVGRQSMDITTAPYEFVKNALYDGRLSIPHHSKLELELASLEKDVKRNKIDHPPQGCVSAETLIACHNASSKTMEELVQDYEQGITHIGVSWDIERQCEVYLPLEKPHITKSVTELIEIEMENGLIVRCTPDHPYLMVSGQYVAAEDLAAGDELQS